MSDTLSLQARIAATPSKVFHALTDETAVTTWLAEHAAISLPEQHYGFWGDTTPQGDQTHQTLLSAEPDRLLRFSWTLDGTPTTVESSCSRTAARRFYVYDRTACPRSMN